MDATPALVDVDVVEQGALDGDQPGAKEFVDGCNTKMRYTCLIIVHSIRQLNIQQYLLIASKSNMALQCCFKI